MITMRHIDLFEVEDGNLYLVPDSGTIIYGHSPEALTNPFAYEARRLIENEDGYRDGWGCWSRRDSIMETLAAPGTRHIADYTRGPRRADDADRGQEDTLQVFAAKPGPRGTAYLGPIVSRVASRAPLPRGPICGQCLGITSLIGIYDIEPWGSHQDIQYTMLYQCPLCGLYRQTGFDDGSDWIGENLFLRNFVRLLPDPYVKTGRLRMTYEPSGTRLNLDGVSLHTGHHFDLLADGSYQHGRVETDLNDRFYFIFSGEKRPVVYLLPGMQARLPHIAKQQRNDA